MAIGVLIKLGMAETVEQAEKMVQQIRAQIQIHPEFKKDLQQLFPNT
ncbi:hypothetical protein [Halalkalibacter wakoensis]|nr:hypothetical protein [Halalkalibacter wakoensis]